MASGNYSINDLLQVTRASAADFGTDHIAATVQAETAWLNENVNAMLSDLVQPTVNQIEVWGNNKSVAMSEVDEYGSALPAKQSVGINASVPLRRFVQKLGWTQKYFEIATPAEMATQYLALRKGYLNELIRQLKKALYRNTSYSFVDKLYNGVTLTVYPLLNADSALTIPDSRNGSTFDSSTHTHFAGAAAFAPGVVNTLISNVSEHSLTKGLNMYIALADVATVTSASASFTSLPDSTTQTLLTQLVSGQTKNNSDLENRQVGWWAGDIPVFVKPWCIANYIVVAATGEAEKPLLYRQRPQASLQGWRIDAPIPAYPLIAETAEAEFGFAVYNRSMAGILYFAGASYIEPTIS